MAAGICAWKPGMIQIQHLERKLGWGRQGEMATPLRQDNFEKSVRRAFKYVLEAPTGI